MWNRAALENLAQLVGPTRPRVADDVDRMRAPCVARSPTRAGSSRSPGGTARRAKPPASGRSSRCARVPSRRGSPRRWAGPSKRLPERPARAWRADGAGAPAPASHRHSHPTATCRRAPTPPLRRRALPPRASGPPGRDRSAPQPDSHRRSAESAGLRPLRGHPHPRQPQEGCSVPSAIDLSYSSTSGSSMPSRGSTWRSVRVDVGGSPRLDLWLLRHGWTVRTSLPRGGAPRWSRGPPSLLRDLRARDRPDPASEASGLRQSGRLDLNQRPLGPQPTSSTCRCVRPRPRRPLCPHGRTIWTHGTQQSVLARYHDQRQRWAWPAADSAEGCCSQVG